MLIFYTRVNRNPKAEGSQPIVAKRLQIGEMRIVLYRCYINSKGSCGKPHNPLK